MMKSKLWPVVLCILHVYARAESGFVGWEGATYNARKTWGRDPLNDLKLRLKNRKHAHQPRTTLPKTQSNQTRWIEQLSWKPRSYLFHNFLTEKECDYIIEVARPLVRRSTVVGNGTGEVNSVRTSFGTFLPRRADPVIETISKRVAHWTHLPASHQEEMQVLRYGHQQKYGAHLDALEEGSHRMATVILYLSNVEEGGETSFVKSWNWLSPEQADRHGPFSECGQGHVSVKPRKGDALLFYSFTPYGVLDATSEHTGCPVLKGTKWTSTLWIHSAPFRPEELEGQPERLQVDPGLCMDAQSSCKDWQRNGECEKNREYMAENCAQTCGVCRKCEPRDRDCYNENRKRAGLPKIEDVS